MRTSDHQIALKIARCCGIMILLKFNKHIASGVVNGTVVAKAFKKMTVSEY